MGAGEHGKRGEGALADDVMAVGAPPDGLVQHHHLRLHGKGKERDVR